MGKTSKYPSYSSGSVSLNGETKSTNTKNGNEVNSNYNMSDTEKNIFDYAQNALWNTLPQINVFSGETQKNINSQLDAYKNKGIQTINEIYSPMINNLKNDIASRFGNFNNSVFMDNLNSIEQNRANAVNSLAQDIETQRNTLYNNELNQRYNYLNYLNGLQNQIYNNALGYMNMAQNNASLGNSYNQTAYTADRNNGINSLQSLNNTLRLAQLLNGIYQ